jgi:hypothetical protein
MKISVITCAQAALVIAMGYAMYTNKSFSDESKTFLDTLKPFEVGVATVVEGDERARVDIADKKVRTVTAVLDSDKQMKMFVVQVIALEDKPILTGSKVYLCGVTLKDPISSTTPVYFAVQKKQ